MKETYGNVLECTPTKNQKRIRETTASIIKDYRTSYLHILVNCFAGFYSVLCLQIEVNKSNNNEYIYKL